ncbi:hypothetical protein TRICHSKD4_3615 [Roseibium sp. TrichSKD4]|nr:hypothetical protein TRICHSKD4_3615 [Roseibium sp. TrichSKD4]
MFDQPWSTYSTGNLLKKYFSFFIAKRIPDLIIKKVFYF